MKQLIRAQHSCRVHPSPSTSLNRLILVMLASLMKLIANVIVVEFGSCEVLIDVTVYL